MHIIGRPGAHAAVLVRQRLLRAAAAAGVAVAGGTTVAATGGIGLLTGHSSMQALGALGAGAAVAGVAVARHWWVSARRAMAGLRSERRVARVLASSGAGLLAHGAMLGAGGDADHVLAGPCLVVVETKTGRGSVAADNTGLRVRGRRVPGDPIGQVQRQADALARIAGFRAAPIVCVTDMEQGPFVRRGVTVCSLRDLPHVVTAAPRALTPANVERMARMLEGRVGH